MHEETAAFWEDLYTAGGPVWSGDANRPLVDAVAGLIPGRALDLGCGEGGDAVHLARLGWRVTAVDISPTALARTRALAEEAGVADRVATERHDLAATLPAGPFDLVTALFFQSPLALDRAAVLRRAADALEVGGRLVLVEHGSGPSWSEHGHENEHEHGFPTPQELHAALELDPARFEALAVESRERAVTGPDGRAGTLLDSVVVVTRSG